MDKKELHEEQTRPADVQTTEKTKKESAEHGGRKGLEPTRYGDWEKNGRCIDF